MSDSQRPASHSAKTCPTLEDTRRAIIDHITADAIDAYETARRRFSTYDAAFRDDHAMGAFGRLIDARLDAARDYLVRVLLARAGHIGDDDAGPEGRIRPTTGVIAGGCVYLASVTHDYVDYEAGESPGNAGRPLMGLTVADRGDVAEMELADLDADEG